MKHETKLTSVKILKSLYEQFKFKTVNSNMNLQKLVNRCVVLYINDKEFRNKINSCKLMQTFLSLLQIIGRFAKINFRE